MAIFDSFMAPSRNLLCSLVVFFFFSCSTITAFDYVETDTFSAEPRIAISDVNDFVSISEANSVDTLFIQRDDAGEQSVFLFPLNGILYTLQGKGFVTIPDYVAGDEAGFPSRASYDDAASMGFSEFDTYADYLSSWFRSPDDYRDAADIDFGSWTSSPQEIIFPEQITIDKFESTILPLLIRRKLTVTSLWDNRWNHFVFINLIKHPVDGAELQALGRHRSVSNLTHRDTPSHEVVQRAVRSIPQTEYRAFIDNLRNQLLEEDILSRFGFPYQDDGEIYRTNNNGLRGWSTDIPAVAYYWAPLLGYSDLSVFLDQYDDLVTSTRLGYESITDWRDALDRGFENSFYYYEAVVANVDNAKEYEYFRQLGIESQEYHDSYQRHVFAIDEIIEQMGRSSDIGHAVALYAIDRIPAGSTLSISVVPDQVNQFLNLYPALKNLEPRFLNRFSSRSFSELQRIQEVLLREYGTISETAGTFTAH